MKNMIVKYKVGNIGSVERLSPQLKLLVQSINECSYEVKGENDLIENEVIRSDIFERWSELCKSNDNVKVFASHIHSFIVFGYLVKMTVAKVVTKEDVIALFNKLNEEEKKEIIKEVANVI